MAPQYSELFLPIASLIVGLLIGIVSAWLIARSRIELARSEGRSEGEIEVASLNERASRVPILESEVAEKTKELDRLNRSVATLTEQTSRLPQLEEMNGRLIEERDGLNLQVAKLGITLSAKEDSLQFKEEAQKQLANTFKLLANDILEEKTTSFTKQNQTNLEQILGPLRTKIEEFQGKVETIAQSDGLGRSVLGEQVRHLTTLNQQLSEDAKNLTSALKGSSKTQGNWGEMILERVLESSGLQKGREYELRESYKHPDGSRGQPDVVINLPESRHLVIDAKVSLTDYDLYVKATDEIERESAADRHLQSIRRHMRDLSDKNYQELLGLRTLDFVVMFVPIEPAFMLAIGSDASLWETALKKNVLLVSPSALLFVLRTVAVLWRQEEQAKHVRDIAKRGAELYNRLVSFVEELQKVGKSLRQAQDSFDEASKRLSTGQGNVIRQAEMLKKLGVRPSKSLPQGMVEEAMQESLMLPELAAFEETETLDTEENTVNQELPEEEIPF